MSKRFQYTPKQLACQREAEGRELANAYQVPETECQCGHTNHYHDFGSGPCFKPGCTCLHFQEKAK